ncbi:uncharacterized protein PAC_09006 [Phialocephala subalpina]|uniref:Uncharacterized protein n=1 Tax=Phialocephala subalpina TaxID=576137 RepID=A0A1L7X277_9HELO|nr:uncharacterized protein PAC_09006 [Phialocephala subalpina]
MFQHNARFIIRVTIDSRNAITGLLETEGPEVFIGKIVNEEQSYKLQEYIVVPTQEKLDGAWPIPRFTSVNDPTQSRTPTRSKRPARKSDGNRFQQFVAPRQEKISHIKLEIIPVNPHGPGNSLCRRASTWADNGPAYLRSPERIPNASPSTPRAPENLHDGRRPGKTGLTAFRGAAGGANRKESLGAEHNGPAASMRNPRNNIVSSERSIEEVGKNLCQLATETIGQRNGMVHPSLEITMPADEEEQNLDALLHEMQHPQRHRLPVRGVNWIEPTIVPSSQAVRESIDRSEPRAGRHEASLDSLLNAHARTGYSN